MFLLSSLANRLLQCLTLQGLQYNIELVCLHTVEFLVEDTTYVCLFKEWGGKGEVDQGERER